MSDDSSRRDNFVQSKRGKWKKGGRGRGGHSGRDSQPSTFSPTSNYNNAKIHISNTANLLNTGGKYIELEDDENVVDGSFVLHWRNYISLTKYESDDFSTNKLQAAKDFLMSRSSEIETTDELFTLKKFSINYNDLISSELLKKKWSNLEKELDDNAELVLGIFGLARYDLWATEVKIRGSLPIVR